MNVLQFFSKKFFLMNTDRNNYLKQFYISKTVNLVVPNLLWEVILKESAIILNKLWHHLKNNNAQISYKNRIHIT